MLTNWWFLNTNRASLRHVRRVRQFIPLELMLDYNLQISVTWLSHVHVLCVSVSAASTYPHQLCGMTFHLNWRTATLVDEVLNLALSHGFLGVPTCNRRLCELLFKGRYINPRFDWLTEVNCCIVTKGSLGEEAMSLEFRHIGSYLLWYCHHHTEDDLLHELILCIGYFCVLNQDNQVQGAVLSQRWPRDAPYI